MQVLSDKLQREQDALFMKWCENDEGLDLEAYVFKKGSKDLTTAIKTYRKMKDNAFKNGVIIN